MITKSKALKIRSLAMTSASELDDADASTIPEMYGRLYGNGQKIDAGTRIYWNGTLKRAAVDLWDAEENSPDNAPNLWEDINYVKGYRAIPEIITVGLAFAKGEKGLWKDAVYESLYDNNVWNPEQFPAGWKVV